MERTVDKCPYTGEVTREKVDRLRDDFEDHVRKQNGALDKIWDKLDRYENRLPAWAVFLISALTAAFGWYKGGSH